jgi:hypothetical protein
LDKTNGGAIRSIIPSRRLVSSGEDLPRAVAALRQGKAVKVVVDLKGSS